MNMTASELSQAIETSILELKRHSREGEAIESKLVTQSTSLLLEHGDASKVPTVVDALTDYGVNGSARAFKYLINTFTGVSLKAGKITDVDKHNQNKEKFVQVLKDVENLGLRDWFKSLTDNKTDEQKAAERAAAKAKRDAKVIAEYKAARANDPILRMIDEYEKKVVELSNQNVNQAHDMVKADIEAVRKSIQAALSKAFETAQAS